jgi:hypothetical protein
MRTLLTLVLVWGAARTAAAQWYVGAEVSATRYGGSSHDTSNAHAASDGRPGDATVLHLRFGRNWGRYGIAIRVAHSKPGLAVAGQGLNLTDKTSGGLSEIAAITSTRVGGIGPSGAVRVEVGPALHLWNFEGDTRTRVGANAAVVYEWLLAGRFTGAVRLEGLLSKSWFDPGDVPPEYERRVTWRYGVGLGLRYRL